MRLAVGAAGGATIIAQVAKAIIGVIDWNLTAQAAIDLPVIFAPGDTVWLETGTALEAMAHALRAPGHAGRSEERREGKAGVSTGRSRGSPGHEKKKQKNI